MKLRFVDVVTISRDWIEAADFNGTEEKSNGEGHRVISYN